MSKIRRALQLLADSGLSTRQVAAVLGISKSTVSEIALYARTAGIDWPLASSLSDEELQARLYPPPRPRSSHRQEPDYAQLHQELKRPGVTLQLLWEEYRERCGEQAYRYSAYCEIPHRGCLYTFDICPVGAEIESCSPAGAGSMA
jgi:transcriptional regulator with XRE-family HTH domain